MRQTECFNNPMCDMREKMLNTLLLTSVKLCCSSSGSATAVTTGASVLLLLLVPVVALTVEFSAEAELSSRHGLPGMIPADLAARSMAPETVKTG